MGIKKYAVKKLDELVKRIKSKPGRMAEAGKKAAVAKIRNFKQNFVAGILGSLGTAAISALFGASDEAEQNRNAQEAAREAANRAAGNNGPTPQDDPTIDLSGVGSALALALPSLPAMQDMLPSSGDYEIANLTLLDNVAIDTSVITEDGETELQLSADTAFRAAIPQIGQLFAMMAALKFDVIGLQGQLDTTNENLGTIRDELRRAILENGRTRRGNERRRDEEDVEEKATSTAGVLLERGIANAKTAAKGFLAVLGGMIASGLAITVGSSMAQAGEEMNEEEPEEETGEALEFASDILTELTVEDGAQGLVNNIADTGATTALIAAGTGIAGSVAAALGVAGGATVAAVAAPVVLAAGAVAAVAGTAAISGALGTAIYDNFFEESVSEAARKKLAGKEIDLGTMDSPEAIKEKYEGSSDIEALGDLLGEGMFDLAEKPAEIAAWFRDNVSDMDTYSRLDKEYNEEYGDPLAVALGRVLGTKGVDSIFQVITNNVINAMAEKKKEPVQKTVNGFKVGQVEQTPKRGSAISDPNQGRIEQQKVGGVIVNNPDGTMRDDFTPEEISRIQFARDTMIRMGNPDPFPYLDTLFEQPTLVETATSDEPRINVMLKDGSYEMMTRDDLIQARKDRTVDRGYSTRILREFELMEKKEAQDGAPKPASEEKLSTESNDYDPDFNLINSDEESSVSEPLFTLPDFSTGMALLSDVIGKGVDVVQEHVKNYNIDMQYQEALKTGLPALTEMAQDGIESFINEDMTQGEQIEKMEPIMDLIGTGMQKLNNDLTNNFAAFLPDIDYNIAQLERAKEVPLGEVVDFTDAGGGNLNAVMTEELLAALLKQLEQTKKNRDWIADLVNTGRENNDEYEILLKEEREERQAIVDTEAGPSAISTFFTNTIERVTESAEEAGITEMLQTIQEGASTFITNIKEDGEELIARAVESTLPMLKGDVNEEAVQQIIPMVVPVNMQPTQQTHSPAGNTTKASVGNPLPQFRAADSFLASQPQS